MSEYRRWRISRCFVKRYVLLYHFLDEKIELLQDYLDSRETLEEEYVDFINDPNGCDIDLEVKGQVSEFKEKLTEKLTGDFQWDDIVIEKFDSNLQYHLKEYLQWKYDDSLWSWSLW